MMVTKTIAQRRFELMAAEYLALLGERIKERRDALGLSRADLARLLPGKTNENQVYRWERGLHQPNPDTLEAIAEVLQRDVAYFMAPAPDKSATPSPFNGATPDVLDRLAEVEQTLTQILKNQEQLLALIGKGAKGEDYFSMVQRTLDTMVSRLGREVGRQRPRPSEGPGQSPPRAA